MWLGIVAVVMGWGCGSTQRDWRDEVIYFALIDRLANGNPQNDDQGAGEWDPARESHFQGGDLEGVLGVLDGVEELGATGIWLTPPVHNQWWNPEGTYTGYHGYWASDFESVDAHFGTLEDWRSLADALHDRGMLLIQDVVVNHTGDWATTTDSGRVVRDRPRAEWLQPESGVYHAFGTIEDYNDPDQVLTFELANLDDLRTESDSVRARLRAIYRWWIEEGGADGFRFDTHKYVEPGFWPAFLEGESGDLGVRRFAERDGRDFPTFGEVWVHSTPFGDEGEQELLKHLRRPGYEGVDAVLNFPLQESLLRVFGEGGAAADLAHRLMLQGQMFSDPARQLVNFIDNHDMARFRATASEAATRQALNSLLSLPGVPVIYQGTEQGDRTPRPNLFGRFDVDAEPFVWLREAIAWRRAHPTLSRGRVVEARAIEATSLLYWSVAHEGDTVHVLCNASAQRVVASETPPRQGGREPVPSRVEGSADLAFDSGRLIRADLSPNAWVAWSDWRPASERVASNGPVDSLWVVDGAFAPEGLASVPNGRHRVQRARFEGDQLVSLSAPEWVEVAHPRRSLGQVEDACGDDRGLSGSILPPTSPGFDHSMDLKSLEVFEEGPEWEIRVRMCAPRWSTVWGPRFGFDHVAFHVRVVNGDSLHAQWRHTGWSLQSLAGAPPASAGVQDGDYLAWRCPKPDGTNWRVVVDAWDADGNGDWRPVTTQAGPYTMGCQDLAVEPVMDRITFVPRMGP